MFRKDIRTFKLLMQYTLYGCLNHNRKFNVITIIVKVSSVVTNGHNISVGRKDFLQQSMMQPF